MIDILILLGLVILVGGVFAGTAYGIYIIEKKYKKPWLKYLITAGAFVLLFIQLIIFIFAFMSGIDGDPVLDINNLFISFAISYYITLAGALSALITSLYISIFKFVIKFTRKDENEPNWRCLKWC